MQISRQPLLLIDDDPLLGSILQATLNPATIDLHQAETGNDGLEQADELHPMLAILDLGLPDTSGIEVLKQLQARHPGLPVIILSGCTDTSTVVETMKLGAFNYLCKPVDTEALSAAVALAIENRRRSAEVRELHERRGPVSLMGTEMGPSPQVEALARCVSQVARTDATVLVTGEPGSGKELVVTALHRRSARRASPLVALDCSAVPELLMESELFGHEKGAFALADRKRLGRLQLADSGTLLLDNIDMLSAAMQARLLQMMETRQYLPMGSAETRDVAARLIAASNVDLVQRVRDGAFSQDLYLRLAEYTIAVPPLRARLTDVAYLARRFVSEAALEMRKPVVHIAAEALELMQWHPWTGNVRELRDLMRDAVQQCEDPVIELALIQSLLEK